MTDQIDHQKETAAAWFKDLRDQICTAFEKLEDDLSPDAPMGTRAPGRFERTSWKRESTNPADEGMELSYIFERPVPGSEPTQPGSGQGK